MAADRGGVCVASVDDDIRFLEELRSVVDAYLFLGYAPTLRGRGFGPPSEGLTRLNAALQQPEHQQLRRKLSEMKPRAKLIMSQCGFPGHVVQYPAPAVGGPIVEFHVLDLVTENDSAHDLPKSKVFELIDQSIGMLKLGRSQTVEASPMVPVIEGYVFIAMPMSESDPDLEDVHDTIKSVAGELGLNAERVDDPNSGERITDRVIASIQKSEHVVVDLTHNRPNVYFEAGYAHALGKLPIYIARRGTSIEFDLKDYPVIFFQNMRQLREGLRKRLGGPAGSSSGVDASHTIGVPQQPKSAPRLTEAARELLLEATQKGHDGTIMRTQTMGQGVQVETNRRGFVEHGNARSEAKWRGAVDELHDLGLIEDRAGKGELFLVTDAGYNAADRLRA